AGLAGESDVPQLSASAPVDDGALELVAALAQRPLELSDEDAEVRVVRPRVHLRDEQDPHPASLADAHSGHGRVGPLPWPTGQRRGRSFLGSISPTSLSDSSGV